MLPTRTRFLSSKTLASVSTLSVINDCVCIGVIKNKLKNYIEMNDIGLSSLFKVIDTNSDEMLSLAEFMQKMKSL